MAEERQRIKNTFYRALASRRPFRTEMRNKTTDSSTAFLHSLIIQEAVSLSVRACSCAWDAIALASFRFERVAFIFSHSLKRKHYSRLLLDECHSCCG